jgi:hypothetical protein
MLIKTGPNTILSDDGWIVEVLGRTGLLYSELDRAMKVDSEVLAGPAGMVVYSRSIRQWLPPYEHEAVDDGVKARIIENIRMAFKFDGFDIDIL